MKKLLLLAIAALALNTGFSQDKTKAPKTTTTQTPTMYTCSMHPEVVSSKPGKCPKCGMTLVEKIVYVCPMHPEVVSDKPGKCPKCGMQLKIKETAKKNKQ